MNELVDILWDKKEKIIRKWYNPNQEILDVGCRRGEFVSRFSEKKFGIDLFDEYMKEAEKKGIKTFKIDLDSPFELKKTFKNIFCLDVLEHLKNPSSCVKSCYKHLDKDGIAFFSVPYFGFVKRTIASAFFFDKVFGYETEHIRFLSPTSMRKLLRDAGFKIIKEYKIGRFYPVNMDHLFVCKK
ncbi:MAG: class I SAM-dependent methyltransferase [Candidatus Aenigmatarchaeota archaeon]